MEYDHIPENMPVWYLSAHFAASKNRNYRESLTLINQAIIEVFDEFGFSNVSLAERFSQQSDQFKVSFVDLTHDGKLFVANQQLDKWLSSVRRWKQPFSPEQYKNRLKQRALEFKNNS